MGYESKIIIVNKCPRLNEELDKFFAETIAIYNVGKYPEISKAFPRPTDCYIYFDGSSEPVLEDKYGSPLMETDLNSFIHFLEAFEYDALIDIYIPPLLGLLIRVRDYFGKLGRLAVLHYGH